MQIILDNIIYSLQHGGGASVVWTEHISRLMKDDRFEVQYIEYENAENNVFRRDIYLPNDNVKKLSNRGFMFKRYMDVRNESNEPYVFHSSHYRIDKNLYARNVTTVHDFVYEYFSKGIKKGVHSWQKWGSIRKADVIICISESTKRDLLHFLPDVDESKIRVVYHGVDETYRQLNKDEYGLHLPYETGEYALYVGNRTTPYKNFRLVVDVCSKLNMPLITVGGEATIKPEIEMLKNRLGGGNFIQLRGLSNTALNELYNRARVFMYPSLYEGFGIPVIEAQRAGVPVICASRSSIPEIVGDTDLCIKGVMNTEIICEMIRALDDTSFRKKEIEKGLLNAKRFSWDRTFQQTTDIYLSLLK